MSEAPGGGATGDRGQAGSAGLALSISDLVSRQLAGETIDVPGEAMRLAIVHLELGVSGPMIESAIARAVGMVGSIRASAAASAARNAGPVPEIATAGPADDPQAASTDSALIADTVTAPEAGAARHIATLPDARPLPGLLSRVSRRPVAAVRRALFRA